MLNNNLFQIIWHRVSSKELETCSRWNGGRGVLLVPGEKLEEGSVVLEGSKAGRGERGRSQQGRGVHAETSSLG